MSNERQVHQNNATGNTGPVVQNRDVYGDLIINIIDGLSALTGWVKRKLPIVPVVLVVLAFSGDANITATQAAADAQYRDCGPPQLSRGPILDKYLLARANGPVIGCPIGPARPTWGGGQVADFEHLDARYPDRIYWSPATGARRVFGEIGKKWIAIGAEAGPLGFPVTDEVDNFNHDGVRQGFQHGVFYWHALRSRGAHVISPEFFVTWEASGYEMGPLGYPIGEERPAAGGGRQQDFERGAIITHPARSNGTHAVMIRIYEKWQRAGGEAGEYGYPVEAETQQGRVYRHRFERGEICWNEAVHSYC